MIYLQKVVALVRAQDCNEELELLGRTLAGQGITFYNIIGECAVQLWERNIQSNHNTQSGRNELQELGTMGKECDRKDDIPSCLWLTDCAEWATYLSNKGQAVLVYLHESNREQNFSGVRYACEKPSELDGEYLDRIYRRYQVLPWDILETERCCIRETMEEDVPAFYDIYAEPMITRYMENLFPEKEQELQYVKDYREKVYDFFGFGVWTVLKKDTGEVIGRAGLSYREGFEEPELGFIIGVPWQRQGYAEEVCRAILKYGREELGFDRVQALVMPANEASIRLCEKLGFYHTRQVELDGCLYGRYEIRLCE